MVFSVLSERQASVSVLLATEATLDGDSTFSHALPSGFGDCAILGTMVQINSIATLVADVQYLGVKVRLLVPSNAEADYVGAAYFVPGISTGVEAAFDVIRPVYWRSEENLNVHFREVDSNASPTATLRWLVRVRRLRDLSHGERQLYLRGMLGA